MFISNSYVYENNRFVKDRTLPADDGISMSISIDVYPDDSDEGFVAAEVILTRKGAVFMAWHDHAEPLAPEVRFAVCLSAKEAREKLIRLAVEKGLPVRVNIPYLTDKKFFAPDCSYPVATVYELNHNERVLVWNHNGYRLNKNVLAKIKAYCCGNAETVDKASGIRISKRLLSNEDIKRTEQVLIDNGIEADEADTVLQAIGYVLLDTELYPEEEKPKQEAKATVKAKVRRISPEEAMLLKMANAVREDIGDL